MKNLDKLCLDLNNRVFQYEVLYVDYTGKIPTIKILSTVTPKLVKTLYFDDLIGFMGRTPIFKDRLIGYAKELSNNEVTDELSFLY